MQHPAFGINSLTLSVSLIHILMVQLCVGVDAVRKIYTAEGVAGLWRSTAPSAVLASNPAIQFMVYEALKRKLQALFHTQVSISYCCCCCLFFFLLLVRLFIKKLDCSLFHHIFALTATDCMKISRNTSEVLLVVNRE